MTEKQEKELFKVPAVKPATIPELVDLSEDLGLKCSEDELREFKDFMNQGFASTYQRVSELVGPTLPVKYPRTPGYRPGPEENIYNAWYWKCNIEGAPDGILKGKKIAIKDNCCVAGVPMCIGSTIMEGYTPEVDATIVTRILDAGGTITGKANCEFLCFSGCSWTTCTGPTLNPHDVTRSAGGSSGGSAALVFSLKGRCIFGSPEHEVLKVQAGEVDMAIGGDQGGSIRIPASWCGTVGLKPTLGLVPYTGAAPVEITMDHLGPIVRNVEDCALLLEVIAGYDNGFDPRQPRELKVRQYSKELTADFKGKKVGLVKEGFDWCEDDVSSIVKEAANKLNKAGAIVEEISIPMHADGVHIWAPACLEGAYKCVMKGNGNGHHWKGLYVESLQEALYRGFKVKAGDMSDTLKLVTLECEYIDRNYGNKFYAKCQNLAILLERAYNKALESYDAIVMPTMLFKSLKLPEKTWSLTERLKNATGNTRNTGPFNVTGHPALTINAGFSEGLPVGMMIVGKHFDETTVLQVAYAVEKLRDEK